jgi:hypothetical protein
LEKLRHRQSQTVLPNLPVIFGTPDWDSPFAFLRPVGFNSGISDLLSGSFEDDLAMLARQVFAVLMGTAALGFATLGHAADPWLSLEPPTGKGNGKHVVLISGDEEYRSEELLPQLGKILSQRHGFRCTVLFAINPENGTIDPNNQKNIPGLEALDKADLAVMLLRFRNLPDEQMKHLVDYTESGRPMIGLRTATHAFKLVDSKTYEKYTYKNNEWPGGFGKQVLGETWINHHGKHGSESTRARVVADMSAHPILRGITDGEIWGPTDVYQVNLPLADDCQTLLLGEVVAGMHESDPKLDGKKNDPMMPVAWTKSYTGSAGKTARIFTTTMGASQDFASTGLRRLLVNACYWCVGMEDQIKPELSVELVGKFDPSPFGVNKFKPDVKPESLLAD